MKGKLTTALLVLIFLTGLSLLLYPTAANIWNSFHQSRVVSNYDRIAAAIPPRDYTEGMEAARAYNQSLLYRPNRFLEDAEGDAAYQRLLRVAGSDVLGILEIPGINVRLSIYHGTGDNVLQVGVGHIAGSSLPVGGIGTHAALSGHTGLPSAWLLTDMDQLEYGDRFTLRVFGDTLVYEVDQILVVLPHEMDSLAIDPERDYVTLVTCTPYGINTHRLLVRGERVFPQEEINTLLVSEAADFGRGKSIALFGAPVFLLMLILYAVFRKRG